MGLGVSYVYEGYTLYRDQMTPPILPLLDCTVLHSSIYRCHQTVIRQLSDYYKTITRLLDYYRRYLSQMWFMNRCGANPSIRWSC